MDDSAKQQEADRPRAPAYLLSLHEARDELRAHPPRGVWVAGSLLLVALPLAVGAGLGVYHFGEWTSALPWVGIAALVAVPAVFAAREVLAWRREIRKIERGIALFDEQAEKRAGSAAGGRETLGRPPHGGPT